MTNEQQQVKNWMLSFGQEVKEKPEIPSLEVRKLRAKLILEEALETIINGLGFLPSFKDKGTGEKWTFDPAFDEIHFDTFTSIQSNLTEILDGCEDLKVVVEGTLAACGLLSDRQEYFDGMTVIDDEDPHFNEVMRSNWSKMWTREEAMDYNLKYKEGMSNYEFIRVNNPHVTDRIYLVKNKDGKVIKSPSYSPPSFTI